MYAINIADLTELQRHPEHAALVLVLKQHIDADPEKAVECEYGKIAGIGYGAPFTCPDSQVEALVQIVRRKLKNFQLRIYRKGKGWKRV